MDDLDRMVVTWQVKKAKREVELRTASRDSRSLNDQATKDAARLLACIGGYAVPVFDQPKQDEWIRQQMETDALFVAKVKALVALLLEYAEIDR